MKTNNLGKSFFENEKLKLWQVDEKDKVQEAIVKVDLEKEKFFQSRVYPLISEDLKILAKQNLKTGQIEAVAFLQREDEKMILGKRIFQDENEFSRNIKNFELELSLLIPLDPKKVLITTSDEFEKIFQEIRNEKKNGKINLFGKSES